MRMSDDLAVLEYSQKTRDCSDHFIGRCRIVLLVMRRTLAHGFCCRIFLFLLAGWACVSSRRSEPPSAATTIVPAFQRAAPAATTSPATSPAPALSAASGSVDRQGQTGRISTWGAIKGTQLVFVPGLSGVKQVRHANLARGRHSPVSKASGGDPTELDHSADRPAGEEKRRP